MKIKTISAPTSQASLLAFTSAAMLNLSAESANPTSDNIDMLGLDFTGRRAHWQFINALEHHGRGR